MPRCRNKGSAALFRDQIGNRARGLDSSDVRCTGLLGATNESSPFQLRKRLLALLDTDQTRDRFPAPGDDDRLAFLDPPKVLAELVVKLADPYLALRQM